MFQKGNTLGKANGGRVFTTEHRKKLSDSKKEKPTRYWLGKRRLDMEGENHWGWKGDAASYYAMHLWIRKQLGNPGECVYCGERNKKNKAGKPTIQWANIDHAYSRDVEDYIPLCYSCHVRYDNNLEPNYA